MDNATSTSGLIPVFSLCPLPGTDMHCSLIAVQAMNRSLANVILGGYSITAKEVAEKGEALSHQETDVNGAVDAITNARSVIIVPGYGLAVASAQYAIADLVKTLTSKDIKVRSADATELLFSLFVVVRLAACMAANRSLRGAAGLKL